MNLWRRFVCWFFSCHDWECTSDVWTCTHDTVRYKCKRCGKEEGL